MTKKKRQQAGAPSGAGGRCPHLQAGVDLAAVRKTLRQLGGTADARPCRPACDGCAGGATGGLWLCLRCAGAGCGRYSDCRHALKHFKAVGHPVALSLDLLQAWCYVCDRELPPAAGSGDFASACNLLRCHADRLAALPTTPNADGSPTGSKAATGRECRGLSNLGNTCFLNSILQCLAHLPGLAQALARHVDAAAAPVVSEMALMLSGESEPLRLRLTEPAGRVTKCLAATLEAIRGGQQAAFRPSELLNLVTERNPRFRGRQQQDAHELLRTLLDACKMEEVRRVQAAILASLDLGKSSDPKQVPPELRDRARVLNHSARDSTMIDAQFSGRLLSELVCLQCGRKSRTPEMFQDLMLPIAETVHHRPPGPPRSAVHDGASELSEPKQPRGQRQKSRKQQRLTRKQQKRVAKQQRQVEKGRLDELEAEKKLESLTLEDAAAEPEKAELDARSAENPDKEDGSGVDEAENLTGDAAGPCKSAKTAEQDILDETPVIVDANDQAGSQADAALASKAATEDASDNSDAEAESTTLEQLNRTDTLDGCLADSSEADDADEAVKKPALASVESAASPAHHLRHEPPPPQGTLEYFLSQFTSAELLTAGNRVRCESCSALTDHSKRLLIEQPPRLLTLQLKRFAQHGRQLRKSGVHVRCPLRLRLPHDQQREFRLCSLVEHSGSLAGGHYTAYVCAESGRWYHISDSHVSPASEAQALNAEAYLLFYARIDSELLDIAAPHTGATFAVSAAESETDGSLPAESVPAESVPAESVPAESVPAESVPAESVPAESVPTESVPAESVPVESVPAESVHAESVPAESVPAESMPAESVPAESVHAESVPAESVPAESVPVESVPAESVPAESVPVESVPGEAATAVSAEAGSVPIHAKSDPAEPELITDAESPAAESVSLPSPAAIQSQPTT